MEATVKVKNECRAHFQNEMDSMERLTEENYERSSQFQIEVGSEMPMMKVDYECSAPFQIKLDLMKATRTVHYDRFAQYQIEMRSMMMKLDLLQADMASTNAMMVYYKPSATVQTDKGMV
jgi:hypothetical protein